MNTKKRVKYSILGIVFFLLIIFGYFLSYPVIIPLMEKIGFEKLAYFIYEPAEWLRMESDNYWFSSERTYLYFGGNASVSKRFFFDCQKRRMLERDSENRKTFERINYKKNNDVFFKITEWYSNGNICYLQQFPDEQNEIQVNWFRKNGSCIASGIYQITYEGFKSKMLGYAQELGVPYTGTFILPDAQKQQSYLAAYLEGKEVGRTYTFGKLSIDDLIDNSDHPSVLLSK